MLSNLKGLAILALSVGAMLGLGHAYPALRADRFFDLYTAVALAAVSIAAAAQGVRARILFLPTWFVGLGAVSWACGGLGGVWWVPAVIAGVADCVAGMVLIGIADEQRSWVSAPEALEAARNATSTMIFWKAASEAFHVPTGYTFPPNVSAHDLQVLELAATRVPLSELPGALAAVREQLEISVRDLEKKEIDRKLVCEVVAWLSRKSAEIAPP